MKFPNFSRARESQKEKRALRQHVCCNVKHWSPTVKGGGGIKKDVAGGEEGRGFPCERRVGKEGLEGLGGGVGQGLRRKQRAGRTLKGMPDRWENPNKEN